MVYINDDVNVDELISTFAGDAQIGGVAHSGEGFGEGTKKVNRNAELIRGY